EALKAGFGPPADGTSLSGASRHSCGPHGHAAQGVHGYHEGSGLPRRSRENETGDQSGFWRCGAGDRARGLSNAEGDRGRGGRHGQSLEALELRDALEVRKPRGSIDAWTVGTMKRSLLRWLTRTPVQTFVLCPLLVVAFELVRQGERLTVVPAGLALLAWGYLQYLMVGRLRSRFGGGGPGIGGPPGRVRRGGGFRFVSNPM